MRIVGVNDGRLQFQQIHETAETGAALLIPASEIGQPLDWLDQDTDIEQEGDQVGEIEGRPQDADRAHDRTTTTVMSCVKALIPP